MPGAVGGVTSAAAWAGAEATSHSTAHADAAASLRKRGIGISPRSNYRRIGERRTPPGQDRSPWASPRVTRLPNAGRLYAHCCLEHLVSGGRGPDAGGGLVGVHRGIRL